MNGRETVADVSVNTVLISVRCWLNLTLWVMVLGVTIMAHQYALLKFRIQHYLSPIGELP